MIIKNLDSENGSATVKLSRDEISILTNCLYESDKSKSHNKDFKELHSDFYLLSWLVKDGKLCSDDYHIALNILEAENKNGK